MNPAGLPMRLDSPIYRIALWITSILPIALGSTAIVCGLWENPRHWVAIPIGLLVAGMSIVPLQLARKLHSPVLLTSACSLTAGPSTHAITGGERCELKRFPRMSLVLLTLPSGVEVLFIPTLDSYFEIKKHGAQSWWEERLAAAAGEGSVL
jgi:hypothetical protein